MIEINLLPGARKTKRSRTTSVDFGAFFGGLATRIRDPYMIGSIATVAVAALIVGGLWFYQRQKVASLGDREAAARQVASQYSVVIADRNAAQAERDSVVRQIDVIKAIDGSRYVWPHILREIASMVPPYTWLKQINQTSAVSGLSPEVEMGITPAGKKAKSQLAATADSAATAAGVLTFRVIGQTVDIQALTRFMKELEGSPFIEDVQLAKSDVVAVNSTNGPKEATEFTLDMKYQKPDSAFVRRVPLRIGVR